MEGLRYFGSWDPTVGQRWHCKSLRASFSGVVKAVSGDSVLLDVSDVGERWLDIEVLKKNFFPIPVGQAMIA